jgi:hypothetical protein
MSLRSPSPTAHRRKWRWWFAVPAVFTVIGLLMVGSCDNEEDHSVAEEAKLVWYFIEMGRPVVGNPGRVLKKGDQIQFRYQAGGRRSLVLVSIDNDGNFSTLHPRRGDKPVPITPFGEHILQSNLILDTAPGLEIYIAYFGSDTVAAAVAELKSTWATGQLLALKKLDADRSDMALLVLLRGD